MTFNTWTVAFTAVFSLSFTGLANAQKPRSKPKVSDSKSAQSASESKQVDLNAKSRSLDQLKKEPSWREPRDGQVPRFITPKIGEALKPVGKPIYFEGTLDRMEDGALILSNPMSESMRTRWAQKRKVPVSAAPLGLERVFRIVGNGPSASIIRRRIGSKVRLEVVQDRQGFLWVTDVLRSRK